MPIPRDFANNTKYFANRNPQPNKPRPPLRTFQEIAEMFGLTYGQLKSHVAQSRHKCPEPMFKGGGPMVNRSTYYKLAEFKAWWKLRQQEIS